MFTQLEKVASICKISRHINCCTVLATHGLSMTPCRIRSLADLYLFKRVSRKNVKDMVYNIMIQKNDIFDNENEYLDFVHEVDE